MQTSKLVAVFAIVLAVGWFAGRIRAIRAEVHSSRARPPPPAAPFSGAVLVGNTLYLSGQLGLEANQQVPASVDAEATNVLGNVQKTLDRSRHDDGRPGVRAGLLRRRRALRRVQQDLSRLLQAGVSRAGVPRLRQAAVRRALRSAGHRGQATTSGFVF